MSRLNPQQNADLKLSTFSSLRHAPFCCNLQTSTANHTSQIVKPRPPYSPPLDRPMKVEIVVDPARIPPPPLATRVAPATKQAAPARGDTNTQATGVGARRGGGRLRGKGNKGPQKTAADLDAEMEDYQKAKQ